MKYQKVLIEKHGGPEVLRVVDGEVPEPSRDQVCVRVRAAGISYADLLMREGLHPEGWFRGLPLTPGWDVLGVIDRIGEDVTTLQPGQLVAALPIVGGNAEYLCLPEDEWVPVPAGLDAAEALALVFNYVTAYQMLHRSARVKTGERVLIHSAAGGIGSALLQAGPVDGTQDDRHGVRRQVPTLGRTWCACNRLSYVRLCVWCASFDW